MQYSIQVNPIIVRNGGPKDMCILPYYRHPKGCPNYGRKRGCPPHSRFYDDIYDISKPIYAIYNVFDFAGHVQRMRDKHPNWSQRQLECCLYWQGTARKALREYVVPWMGEYPGYSIESTPEAMGVDITNTLLDVGVALEWPPVHVTYQVVLGGIRRTT